MVLIILVWASRLFIWCHAKVLLWELGLMQMNPKTLMSMSWIECPLPAKVESNISCALDLSWRWCHYPVRAMLQFYIFEVCFETSIVLSSQFFSHTGTGKPCKCSGRTNCWISEFASDLRRDDEGPAIGGLWSSLGEYLQLGMVLWQILVRLIWPLGLCSLGGLECTTMSFEVLCFLWLKIGIWSVTHSRLGGLFLFENVIDGWVLRMLCHNAYHRVLQLGDLFFYIGEEVRTGDIFYFI